MLSNEKGRKDFTENLDKLCAFYATPRQQQSKIIFKALYRQEKHLSVIFNVSEKGEPSRVGKLENLGNRKFTHYQHCYLLISI